MSRYKGDSPGKKLVRAGWWMRVRELLGVRFDGGKFLCLAGAGGDVSSLIGLGARAERITAVDTSETACELVSRRFPAVNVRCEDVGNAAVRDWYDAVLLDFCGVFDAKTLQLAARICFAQQFGRKEPVVIGIQCQAGRDFKRRASRVIGDEVELALLGRVPIDTPYRELSMQLASGEFEFEQWVRYLSLTVEKGYPRSLLRCTAAYGALGEMTRLISRGELPPNALSLCCQAAYFSNTAKSGGVPMFLTGVMLNAEHENMTGVGQLGFLFFETPLKSLRLLATTCSCDDQALLFDLDPRQLAAWRAVATRKARAGKPPRKSAHSPE